MTTVGNNFIFDRNIPLFLHQYQYQYFSSFTGPKLPVSSDLSLITRNAFFFRVTFLLTGLFLFPL